MIDTDQYEGHTPTEEWGDIVYADGYLPIFLDDDVYATALDRQLMADAPLLFEEVKRLRENIKGYIAIWDYLDPKGYAWEEEEFVALLKEHGFEKVEVGEEE